MAIFTIVKAVFKLQTSAHIALDIMILTHYYHQIIEARNNPEVINDLLNLTLKDQDILLKDYKYLTTIALSLGFSFYAHFSL